MQTIGWVAGCLLNVHFDVRIPAHVYEQKDEQVGAFVLLFIVHTRVVEGRSGRVAVLYIYWYVFPPGYMHTGACVCVWTSHPSWCSFSITSFLCRNRLLCLVSTKFPRQKTTLFLRCLVWWCENGTSCTRMTSPQSCLSLPACTCASLTSLTALWTIQTDSLQNLPQIFWMLTVFFLLPCFTLSVHLGVFLSNLSVLVLPTQWLITYIADWFMNSIDVILNHNAPEGYVSKYIYLINLHVINVIKPNLFADNRLFLSLSLSTLSFHRLSVLVRRSGQQLGSQVSVPPSPCLHHQLYLRPLASVLREWCANIFSTRQRRMAAGKWWTFERLPRVRKGVETQRARVNLSPRASFQTISQ